MRVYQEKNVSDAAIERIKFVFDNFKNVVCSISGGKDSTLMTNLAYKVAYENGRELNLFFLDQEAEYQSTIDIIRDAMTKPGIVPHWYQVPIYMTNATSYDQAYLYAWGPGEKWMREKDPIAIHSIDDDYPRRFYKFMGWFEKQWTDTAFLVGLRAEESMNRYRAMTKNPGFANIMWSTKSGNIVKFYPIYDWAFEDVFHYFYKSGDKYNKIYDFMFCKNNGDRITTMRVSNLIHEKSFRSLKELQEFEPQTFDALVNRVAGIHTAAIYADEQTMFNARKLPDRFKTWKEYRDYLMSTAPLTHRERFERRFEKQGNEEKTCKHHVKQLLLNDWENNLQLSAKKDKKENTETILEKWWNIL